jgi:uncharacterized protein (TIGR03000 family)
MLRRNLVKWSLAAAVAVLAVAIDARSSHAFGHHRGGWGSSGGSWGSSGGSWGSSGGSWGSSGGSWGSSGGYSYGSWGSSGGSSGGWGHHHRRHAYYGSSGGSWGSSGGSSGGYSYYGSSGGSSGGTVIYDGAVSPSDSGPAGPPQTPPSAPTPGPGSDAPAPMPSAMYRSMNGAQTALLNVSVPAEAKIFVNGAATTSTGMQRQFVSRGLETGNRYEYEVRAEMVRDGNTVTETKKVALAPGQLANLAFNFDSNNDVPVAVGAKTKTKVTLHVPADAKVYLAGNETTSTGDVREFTTTKLAPGADWNNYTIRVVANVNGRETSKEQSITLVGGEDRDLNFNFDGSEVASTASLTR